MQNKHFVRLCCSIWIYILSLNSGTLALSTDMLWESCTTVICGRRPLDIQCDKSSFILINNVSSGRGQEFDQRSYLNLRRMCLGMTTCKPNQLRFCDTHRGVQFSVQYICVRELDVEKECEPHGKSVTNNIGFITSPNYPAETRIKTCKWSIKVPAAHYAHIFLHEVLPISSTEDFCHGLLFVADSTCGQFFPTFPICDESKVSSVISSCSDTDIIMSANSTHSLRFWLSYYGKWSIKYCSCCTNEVCIRIVPVSDLRDVILYDRDITCEAYKKERPIYLPRRRTTPNTVAWNPEGTTPSNFTDEVRESHDSEDEEDTGIYTGIAVAVVVVLVLIVIVAIIYVRRRRNQKPVIAISPSVSNSTDIQKRPLPEFQASTDDNSADPVLHEGYSSVADELSPPENPNSPTYSTYAEIEEYSAGGLKPQPKVINRRSIGSAVRELPATPDEEPYTSTYTEIDDKEKPKGINSIKTNKDVRTIRNKFEENKIPKHDNKYSAYGQKKKMSNASNIYEDCADVINSDEKKDVDKTYVDMSQKQTSTGRSNNKGIKDRFNLSKKTQGVTSVPSVDSTDTKRGSVPRKVTPSWKKESVTSAESDSDDDLCIVENELYEPFESAKV